MRLLHATSLRRGLTLVEMICVIAIISILAALLLPGLGKARDRARQTQCAGQLKQIGLAFHSFAHDHNNRFPMQVPLAAGGALEYARAGNFSNSFAFRHFQALGVELGTPKVLVCPTDARLPAPGFSALSNQNVSFFVALDSDYGKPASVLAGDRNLTNDWTASSPVQRLGPKYLLRWSHELHRFRGNLLFADARVDQWGDAALTAFAAGSGGTTYVLNMPADPIPPRSADSTGSYPLPAATPASAPYGTDGRTRAPVAEPSEPMARKEARPDPAAPPPSLPPQSPTATLTETPPRAPIDSGPPVSGRSAERKEPVAKLDLATNLPALPAPSGSAGAPTPSGTEGEQGFLAAIVDISMKFLSLYYLGLVLLGLLALLLRKHFAPAQAETPPHKRV
jgi:prepilin-type N-terminal cleavage/methylation domain-containing protein